MVFVELHTNFIMFRQVCVDVRNSAAPLFSFAAHDETITAMSFSSRIPGE